MAGQLQTNEVQPPMRVIQTPNKTRFGLFGETPASPAATLFVLAAGVEEMDRNRIYAEAGRQLSRHGWLYVTVDLPCHGDDHRPEEPPTLSGWAHRVKAGQDLMGPFVKRCVDVLEYLVNQGYTDPERVAACGTSRGGFCALHFAAREPRVRAVAGVSPVTNVLALREFQGVTEEQVRQLNVFSLSERLADRAIWMSIGHDDQRVGTENCIRAARQFMAAACRRESGAKNNPIELTIAPSDGHHAIADAYSRAARFLREQFPEEE